MAKALEKLWDYKAVIAGQAGTTTIVELTDEDISRYADVAQNPDPRYQRIAGGRDSGEPLVAMPTMVLTYAPLHSPSARYAITVRQGPVTLLPVPAGSWKSTSAEGANL